MSYLIKLQSKTAEMNLFDIFLIMLGPVKDDKPVGYS